MKKAEKNIASYRDKLSESIEKHKILQYFFYSQWGNLKRYCNNKGIGIIGDIPLYVNYYSVDVWSYPELFKLDREKKPVAVAGVPPDYFSKTGQLWGNPLFNWEILKESGYEWWKRRITRNLSIFDEIRLDHFRGFAGYWSVPTHEKTAMNGEWKKGPGIDFFSSLKRSFKSLSLIAEDLGEITEDVIKLRDHFKLPGMCILQFGFDFINSETYHLPASYPEHSIAYTGTHDNNTLMGWFYDQSTAKKEEIIKFLHKKGVKDTEANWKFIRLLMQSASRTVIIPFQDILGLDTMSRMNTPAVAKGNWQWRLLPDQMSSRHLKKLQQVTKDCGRV